jgi:D-alanyl-D-alanine carboxypeptidase
MAKSSTHNALVILSAVLLLGGGAIGAPKKRAPSKPVPTPTPAPLAPGELPLAAKSAILLDAKSGDVLYE